MNDDMQVTVTLTAEDLAFYDQAKAAGIPSMLVSMYSGALKRLVAAERGACMEQIGILVEAEREACAKVCDEYAQARYAAEAIRARGEK
jgi:hypothetical protein